MSGFQPKITGMPKSKGKKKKPGETNQVSEPDFSMTQTLELKDRSLRITMMKSAVGSDGKSRPRERTVG